jgi:hypothetical protein
VGPAAGFGELVVVTLGSLGGAAGDTVRGLAPGLRVSGVFGGVVAVLFERDVGGVLAVSRRADSAAVGSVASGGDMDEGVSVEVVGDAFKATGEVPAGTKTQTATMKATDPERTSVTPFKLSIITP